MPEPQTTEGYLDQAIEELEHQDVLRFGLERLAELIEQAGLSDKERVAFATWYGIESVLDEGEQRWFREVANQTEREPRVRMTDTADFLRVTESRITQLINSAEARLELQLAFEKISADCYLIAGEAELLHHHLLARYNRWSQKRLEELNAVLEVINECYGSEVIDEVIADRIHTDPKLTPEHFARSLRSHFGMQAEGSEPFLGWNNQYFRDAVVQTFSTLANRPGGFLPKRHRNTPRSTAK